MAVYDKQWFGPPSTCLVIRWVRPFARLTRERSPQLITFNESPFVGFKFSPPSAPRFSNDYCPVCCRGEKPIATDEQLAATSSSVDSRNGRATKKRSRTGRIRRQAKATEIST